MLLLNKDHMDTGCGEKLVLVLELFSRLHFHLSSEENGKRHHLRKQESEQRAL